MFRIFGIFLFACILSACATPNINSSYTPNAANDQGVVFGSISYTGTYAVYRIHYRPLGSDTSSFFEFGSLSGMGVMMRNDIHVPGLRGDLFAAALPAGEYEVAGWQSRSGYISLYPTEPFSIRFKVRAGEAVYLGAFHFVTKRRMALNPTVLQLNYMDEKPRDFGILLEKYPQFAKVPVTSGIPTGGRYEDIGGASHLFISTIFYQPAVR